MRNGNCVEYNVYSLGKYTRDISGGELLIPHRVNDDGTFHSFDLSHFYDSEEENGRNKRSTKSTLRFVLLFHGRRHLLVLEPYHEFISRSLSIERRSIADPTSSFRDRVNFVKPNEQKCYYRGAIEKMSNSRAIVSLCDGVVGYINIDDDTYFIEPLLKDTPHINGKYVHVIYGKNIGTNRKNRNSLTNDCFLKDGWEKSWYNQFFRVQSKAAVGTSKLDKREINERNFKTHSLFYSIKIAIIVDRTFLNFHTNINHEQYLLTIMSMVSNLYHESSIGNRIDIIVERIVYLEVEENEPNLHISRNAEKTLESFSGWVKKLNPTDPQNPSHFNVAVLVTRRDICAEGNNCDILGLAYVAAACDPDKAACISEDSGLLLGVVIAHEIGHTLGCAHDSENISGCPSQDSDDSFFVMSPIVSINTIRWSLCSRKFITSFFESGLGECLRNDPNNLPKKYKYPKLLPGAIYDANFQCQMDYANSTFCDLQEEDCENLWCNVGKNTCKTKSPPADGTKCAEGKWCLRKKCVKVNSNKQAVNGGWGTWGPYGSCSHKCGGGIQLAERECNNPAPKNGGKYCTGERKKYNVCNAQVSE
uniref:Peptidase M12B domain-containing protein n=1 Tax=Trichogramma kaykai TaxID=54128 RepID=A0ABD2XC34_9HYME